MMEQDPNASSHDGSCCCQAVVPQPRKGSSALKAPLTMRDTEEHRTRKFCSHLVNELYPILVGVGLANAMFTLELKAENWDIVMSSVVNAVVVALHWRDWHVHIQGRFVASLTEFHVNFAIVFSLTYIFAHVGKPLMLAGNYTVLSAFDFLWVVNYIRLSEDQSFAMRWKWIAQKVCAIFAFSTCCFVIGYYENTADRAWWIFLDLATEILVRVLLFRELQVHSV